MMGQKEAASDLKFNLIIFDSKKRREQGTKLNRNKVYPITAQFSHCRGLPRCGRFSIFWRDHTSDYVHTVVLACSNPHGHLAADQ